MADGQRNGKFSLNGKFGQNGKLGHSCVRVTKSRLYDSQVRDHVIMHLGFKCKQLRPQLWLRGRWR